MTFVKNDNIYDLFAIISSKKKYTYLTENNITPMCGKLDSHGRMIYIFDRNKEFDELMDKYKKEVLNRA